MKLRDIANIESIYLALGINSTNKNKASQDLMGAPLLKIAERIYAYRNKIKVSDKSEDVISKLRERSITIQEPSSFLSRLFYNIFNRMKNVFAGRGFHTDKQYINFVIKQLTIYR